MKNRFLNDLIPDVFCMFPLLTTIQFYRLFHMAHHQYTNDPERDSDLLNLGRSKRSDEFPMSRERFIALIYFCMITAPLSFAKYQFDYFIVNTMGKGKNIYKDRLSNGEDSGNSPRLATYPGVRLCHWFQSLDVRPDEDGACRADRPGRLLGDGRRGDRRLSPAGLGLFQSPVPRRCIQPASPRPSGWHSTSVLLMVLANLAHRHRGEVGDLLHLLVDGPDVDVVLLLYVSEGRLPALERGPGPADQFPRLLRGSVHEAGRSSSTARTCTSRITSSRPCRIIGSGALHDMLRREHDDYREQVVECHGTFHDPQGRSTILDVLTTPKRSDVRGPRVCRPQPDAQPCRRLNPIGTREVRRLFSAPGFRVADFLR